MDSLVLDNRAVISDGENKINKSRVLRVIGRRLARKLFRRIGRTRVKSVRTIDEAPSMNEVDESLIDDNIANDIRTLIAIRCMDILTSFGSSSLVKAAIDERICDIMIALGQVEVERILRGGPLTMNHSVKKLMRQIATRILSQQNPIERAQSSMAQPLFT